MGANLSLGDLKIPEIWYDVYARLLPGTAFVGALYFFFSNSPQMPNGIGFLIALFFGYFIALVAQPLSSEITRWLEGKVLKHYRAEELYVEKIQKELDERQSMILSKMHGEITFFVQCMVLGIFLLIIRWFYPQRQWTMESYIFHICFCDIFFIGAIEVACRRFKRAQKQKTIKGT